MGMNFQAFDNPEDIPCPYRKGQVRKIFVIFADYGGKKPHLQQAVLDAHKLRDRFVPHGLETESFFVTGNDCPSCQACVPLRIRTSDYAFSKSEQRILRHNHDLQVTITPTRINMEHHALFQKYNRQRHPDSPVITMDMLDLAGYLDTHSHMIEIRNGRQKLVAAIVIDALDHSLAPFTIYYDPDLSTPRRSLGTFCYLKMIEAARENDLHHIYIGAWVDGDDSRLNYKRRFQNLEALTDEGWTDFNPSPHTQGPDLKKCLPAGIPWRSLP